MLLQKGVLEPSFNTNIKFTFKKNMIKRKLCWKIQEER